MSGIIVGILLLSLIMIFHELGHFITGLRLGFKVEEFSLFMGPVLLSFERKGIKYSLKLFPIGASCRFAGEEETDADAAVPAETLDPTLSTAQLRRAGGARFFDRPRPARAIVLFAGVTMNYLTGILAFLIMFSSFGFLTTTVSAIQAGSQAAAAGMQAGDRIVEVNGASISTQLDYVAQTVFQQADEPLDVVVRNQETGKIRTIRLIPEKQEAYQLGITVDLTGDKREIVDVNPDANGGDPVLRIGDIVLSVNGISYEDAEAFTAEVSGSNGEPVTVQILRDGTEMDVETRPLVVTYYNSPGIRFAAGDGIGPSLVQSVKYSWSIVRFTVKGLSMMIAGEIAARDSLSGPIGIVSMVGDVVEEDLPLGDKVYSLLAMFGLISVNLAFMNLLPIPPLDGNHLILTGLEAIRRKRLSLRTQTVISMIGFFLLIGLAIVAVVFDVLRLTGG